MHYGWQGKSRICSHHQRKTMTSHYLGFRKSKKGFIGDIMTLLIILFVLAVTIMSAYLMLNRVNTAFQTTPGISDSGKAIVSAANNKFISLWDGLFVFLLVGLSLAATISAYFVDTHLRE